MNIVFLKFLAKTLFWCTFHLCWCVLLVHCRLHAWQMHDKVLWLFILLSDEFACISCNYQLSFPATWHDVECVCMFRIFLRIICERCLLLIMPSYYFEVHIVLAVHFQVVRSVGRYWESAMRMTCFCISSIVLLTFCRNNPVFNNLCKFSSAEKEFMQVKLNTWFFSSLFSCL